MSRRAALQALFEGAVYRVLEPGQSVINSRIGETSIAIADCLRRHNAQRAVLISARNPQARELPEADNQRLDAELQDWLAAEGRRGLPAEGSAPDRSWVEPCTLILDLSPGQARQLAQQFDQAAWVEYDGQGLAQLAWLDRP